MTRLEAKIQAVLEFMAREYVRTGHVQSDDEATPEQQAQLDARVRELCDGGRG